MTHAGGIVRSAGGVAMAGTRPPNGSLGAVATFSRLVANAPVFAFVKDSDGHYVYANAHLLTILADHMGADWNGKGDTDIWPAALAARMSKDDATVLADGGVGVFTQDMPYPDGAHAYLVVKFAIHDGPATFVAGIGIDLRERAMADADRDRLARERASIGDILRQLRARETPEATAQAICRQVISLTGVTSAQVYLFDLDGRAVPIGFVVDGGPDPRLRPLPFQRSRHLRERAAEGPWIEPWVNRPWHPYNQVLTDLGVHSAAYAPVRSDEEVIGILVIDAASSVSERALAGAMPALVEFADLAGALIGRDVADRTALRRRRAKIASIISQRSFHTVFQPIIDLQDHRAVGFEALTRFDDGVAPDVRFAEAVHTGLGAELETVTLEVALASAQHLPRRAWLSLNVSPALILSGEPLLTLVAASQRPLVLEVTEHVGIADYDAFRTALAAMGPRVRLAVDDAGAGFASLRHILELRPAFVKLDRSLITGLEADEARQAMVAGMRYFSRTTGCRLIAEGVETDAELTALRALRITLAQGFLLGRPTI